MALDCGPDCGQGLNYLGGQIISWVETDFTPFSYWVNVIHTG